MTHKYVSMAQNIPWFPYFYISTACLKCPVDIPNSLYTNVSCQASKHTQIYTKKEEKREEKLLYMQSASCHLMTSPPMVVADQNPQNSSWIFFRLLTSITSLANPSNASLKIYPKASRFSLSLLLPPWVLPWVITAASDWSPCFWLLFIYFSQKKSQSNCVRSQTSQLKTM